MKFNTEIVSLIAMSTFLDFGNILSSLLWNKIFKIKAQQIVDLFNNYSPWFGKEPGKFCIEVDVQKVFCWMYLLDGSVS